MNTIKRVFPFLSEYGLLKRNSVLLVLLMSIAGLFMEAFGLGMMLPVLDYLSADGNVDSLAQENFVWAYLIEGYAAIGVPISLGSLSAAVVIAVFLRQVFDYHYLVRLATLESRLQKNLKISSFYEMQNSSLGYFDKLGSGKFLNLMDRQTEAGALVMSGYVKFFRYCVTFLIYVSLMVVTAPLSSGVSVIVLAFLLFVIQYYVRETEALSKEIVLFRTELSAFLSEAYRAVRTVKIFSIQEKQIATFVRIAERYAQLIVNLAKNTGKIPMLMAPSIVTVMMSFLYVSVTYLDMTVNTITIFVLILMRLAPVAQSFASLQQSLAQHVISLDALRINIEECRDYKEISFGSIDAVSLHNEIKLEDVSYVYPDSPEPALYDINLTLRMGRVIAITGNSGAGKSTLVDLLAALLTPTKGKIFFDQQDLSFISPENIRHALSYAAQEPFLFTGSIIENIRLARPGASDEEVKEACELAYADEFIRNLPHGYDSHLIELGGNLSGGQKQRLALARCFLRESSLLILDEPTSALDPISEDRIRKAIRTYVERYNAIVLLIAHRGTTISDADEIICLENGRIIDHRRLTSVEATTASETER